MLKLNFKISFTQDVFTVIEELTGDCPSVGLPKGFEINKEHYKLFRRLQKKYFLTKSFISDKNKVKSLPEWSKIKEVIRLYHAFWLKNKNKLFEAIKSLKSSMDLIWFTKKVSELTKCQWNTKEVDVYLTLGYKDSGTYDKENNVVRIGIHEGKEKYLVYTLYHELIHYHITNHMHLKLNEKDEEILCRTIFNLLFKEDPIAQQHWKEHLNQNEIRKIEEKSKEIVTLIST